MIFPSSVQNLDADDISILLDRGMMSCTDCVGLRRLIVDWMEANKTKVSTDMFICAMSFILRENSSLIPHLISRMHDYVRGAIFNIHDVPGFLAYQLRNYRGNIGFDVHLRPVDEHPPPSMSMYVNNNIEEHVSPYVGDTAPVSNFIQTITLNTRYYICPNYERFIYDTDDGTTPIEKICLDFLQVLLPNISSDIIIWDWIDVHTRPNYSKDLRIAVAF